MFEAWEMMLDRVQNGRLRRPQGLPETLVEEGEWQGG